MRELFLSNSCLSKHVKKKLNGLLFCGVNQWHFKSVINSRYKANKLDRCPFWKYNYTQMLNFSQVISVHWNGKNCQCTFKFFSFVLFFARARLCLNNQGLEENLNLTFTEKEPALFWHVLKRKGLLSPTLRSLNLNDKKMEGLQRSGKIKSF